VLFTFAREAAGASSARYSLRPLIFRRQTTEQNSGETRRGNAEARLYAYSSCPDLIRASIQLRKKLFRIKWIAGVKPGNDDSVGCLKLNLGCRPCERRDP
jgi:hypothetical protein